MAPFERACDACTRLGFSIIPIGEDKKPLIEWKRYQTEKATLEQLHRWQKAYQPAIWGIVTGAISGIFILDFDDKNGVTTMREWGLTPHVRSGSGGYHVYFKYPQKHILTVSHLANRATNEHWPNVDSRGDGGLALLSGQNEDGLYEILRPIEELYCIDILRPAVQQALLQEYPQKERPQRDPFATYSPPANAKELALKLIDRAIDEEIDKQGGRNNAGFWLACQLRDNNFTNEQMLACLYRFRELAPETNTKNKYEPYTDRHVEATMKSVSAREARSPWEAKNVQPVGPYPIRYVADAFTQEEQQPWLIQNMLRQKMSGIFYGSESTCKSGIAVSLALHVAYGLDMWYGKKIEQGIVAIVAGEGEYDIELLEHAFIQDYESNHSDVTLSRDTKNFILIPIGVPIDNEKAVDALIAQLKVELNGRQLSLLFFDTLTTCLEKANPDQNVDMMRVGRYLRHIQEELHCATIIVTHTGHNQAHVRGASDITRGADATWKMEHDIFSDIYTLTIEKIKGQERKKDIMCFRQKIITLSTQDNFGEFETGYVLELDPFVTAPSLQKIFDILTDEGALNNTQLQAACKEKGIPERKYEAMRDKLIEHGTIICTPGDKNAHIYSIPTSAENDVPQNEDKDGDEETYGDA